MRRAATLRTPRSRRCSRRRRLPASGRSRSRRVHSPPAPENQFAQSSGRSSHASPTRRLDRLFRDHQIVGDHQLCARKAVKARQWGVSFGLPVTQNHPHRRQKEAWHSPFARRISKIEQREEGKRTESRKCKQRYVFSRCYRKWGGKREGGRVGERRAGQRQKGSRQHSKACTRQGEAAR